MTTLHTPDLLAGPPGPRTAEAVAAGGASDHTLADYRDLVVALADVKAAAAQANAAAGVIAPEVAARIVGAAGNLDRLGADVLCVDPWAGGGAVGINLCVDEALAALAGNDTDPLADVNASQSTADVVHTAIRLAVATGLRRTIAALTTLSVAFADAARRADGITTAGRTCGRDAAPIAAAVRLDAAADRLAGTANRCADTLPALAQVRLGTTVLGDGTGAPAAYRDSVIDLLARRTGRSLTAHNAPQTAARHADDLVAVADALGAAADVVGAAADEVRLLNSGPATGFGEYVLPRAQQGSSFFSAKVNPTVPETVIAATLRAHGSVVVARAAARRAELDLHVFDHVVGLACCDAAATIATAAETFAHRCVAGLRVDADRCARHAEEVQR